jgi:hypothetical protein
MYVVLLRRSLSMNTESKSHAAIVSLNPPGENKNNAIRQGERFTANQRTLLREQEHRYGENKNNDWLEDDEVVWLYDAHWDHGWNAHHRRRALEEFKNNRVDSDDPDCSDTMLLTIPIPILLDDDVAYDSDFSDTMPELLDDEYVDYDSDEEYVDITRLTVGHTHQQVDRIAIDTRGDPRGDTRGG